MLLYLLGWIFAPIASRDKIAQTFLTIVVLLAGLR